ncbi:hypothetical protein ONE63_004640 [Megalurothrips usitatus]|uniref:Platelet-derived growth factor (PDGF) family profile domain-containing protein n=1 Tax=Megalurothrips usitatus TaxID=439358 RepID=A0AAV7X0C2_9NEOP|nr:hypothetical protein ONE63_004640 [Megalurothrips usitatus]
MCGAPSKGLFCRFWLQALRDSPLSFSEQKWNSYGSRETLAYTRRFGASPETQASQRLAKEAKDHMMRMMMKEGLCKVPKPVVINVKQVYPDPSREYIPHCTILHRCTDQTGCCRTALETCKPKATGTHKVELAFYMTRVGHREPIVETLTFYNETECECVRVNRDEDGGRSSSSSSNGFSDHYQAARKQRQTRTQLDMPLSYIQLAPYSKPGTYSPREVAQPKGCTCDCFDRQTDCLKYKRGKGYFSMEDRLCIQTNQCKLPECEFGSYMKLSGRCPKKNEKFTPYYNPYRRP